jgi:hypothetical protein
MSGLLAEPDMSTHADAIPAQLCWEAAQLCRALDTAAEQLETALAEAAEHVNAVIEIALLLDRASPRREMAHPAQPPHDG